MINLAELKRLAKKLGGILVISGNEPDFVILPYEKYRELDSGSQNLESNLPFAEGSNLNPEEEQIVEKLNQEILALKEEIKRKEELELTGLESETKVSE